MPNATVRANARTLSEANCRAVLNAVFGDDAIDAALWSYYRTQKDRCNQLTEGPATEEECRAAFGDLFAFEHVFRANVGKSIGALAAVLVTEIEGESPEEVDGLYRASLAAIRPQLDGAIAEDADRVLAKSTAPEPSSDDVQKTEETIGEIRRAIEALRHTHEAELALAADDVKRDRIRGDIEACSSLLRDLAVSEEARA